MSASPKFMIEVRDIKTNKWHKLNMKYEIGEKVIESEVYPYNGNHELFSYLKTDRGFDADDACLGIHYGLPLDVSDEVKKVYNKWFDVDSCSSVYAKYVYLSDIMYSIAIKPKVKDDDIECESDTPIYKDNPLKTIADIIINWVDFSEFFYGVYEHMSDIRLVYWVV